MQTNPRIRSDETLPPPASVSLPPPLPKRADTEQEFDRALGSVVRRLSTIVPRLEEDLAPPLVLVPPQNALASAPTAGIPLPMMGASTKPSVETAQGGFKPWVWVLSGAVAMVVGGAVTYAIMAGPRAGAAASGVVAGGDPAPASSGSTEAAAAAVLKGAAVVAPQDQPARPQAKEAPRVEPIKDEAAATAAKGASPAVARAASTEPASAAPAEASARVRHEGVRVEPLAVEAGAEAAKPVQGEPRREAVSASPTPRRKPARLSSPRGKVSKVARASKDRRAAAKPAGAEGKASGGSDWDDPYQ